MIHSVPPGKTNESESEKRHYAKESYGQVARQIIAKDGLSGLFARGLVTRLATNAVQGMMFSVVWKSVEEHLNGKAGAK